MTYSFRELSGDDARGMGWISRDGTDVAATGAMELSRQDNLAIAAAMLSSLTTRGKDTESPINHTAVTNILDRAHAALRGMECEKIPIELPRLQEFGCEALVERPDLDRATDAIAAIEEFARERKITLSEFRK